MKKYDKYKNKVFKLKIGYIEEILKLVATEMIKMLLNNWGVKACLNGIRFRPL